MAIPDAVLVPMTIGANGVKVYSALDYASIINVNLSADYQFSKQFVWNSQLVYSKGRDFNSMTLPFIAPFSYTSSLHFAKEKIAAEILVHGNTTQTNYSTFYGEDKTPSYAIINVSFGYKFLWSTIKIQMKSGVENILDTYYSTYSDWNNLPRMGRNVFVNLALRF
jgi:iron complex outermembrane receptor protein